MPWWMGETSAPETQDNSQSIVEQADTGMPGKDGAEETRVGREAVIEEAQASTGPRPPSATLDGNTRLMVRLENFGDMTDEWIKVEATNLGTGDVFLDRNKGDFVSLEVEPGNYSVSARIGDAPERVRQAQKSVVRLESRQQDHARQKVRVFAGKVSEVVFEPMDSGSISGTVRRGREVMEGVHVILQAEESVMATTDANGQYRFDGVGTGFQEVHLGRPWIGVSAITEVEKGSDQIADLEMPSSGFRVLVRHEEFDVPLPSARVQIRFFPQRTLEDGPQEALAQDAVAEEILVLPTGKDGLTAEIMTGPGQVNYVVYGPQNFGLAGEAGSFMVEASGSRQHVVGLRGGTEVTVTRESGEAGRMSLAYFVLDDGSELGCGGIERLDDNSGYRVWGVPRDSGRLYLTRMRSKTMWVADVPSSYEQQQVQAEELSLIPVHVRSVRYTDGRADYGVTLLAVHKQDGTAFPIGPITTLPFGLRSTARKGMALRPAEVTALPPGSYTLYFKGRNHKVQAVPLVLAANTDKKLLDLVFKS